MSSSESFLVELAAALVKCRKLFLTTFALVLALGIGYQFLDAPNYRYVTLIELAESGDGTLLETSEGVITAIQNQWLPKIAREFQVERGSTPKFTVNVKDVEGGYILLSSVGVEKRHEAISWVHSSLASKVLERQSFLERLARDRLEDQIEVAEQAIESVTATKNSESSGASLFETMVSLKGKLAGMQSANTLVVALQKDKPLGLGFVTRVALVVLAAFVAGLIAVLLYIFGQRVRQVVHGDIERG